MSSESTQIEFSSLILGFSSAALSYLGYSEENPCAATEANLSLAAQNIEIIALLKEKTKNNLSKDEEELTQQVLTDLRMKFVEAKKNLKK